MRNKGTLLLAQRRQRWLIGAALVLLTPVLLIYTRFAIVEPIRNWVADDLAINYSAAIVLREGGLIYDAAALRAAHEAHIGPADHLYTVLFLTYNNTPITALLFWPLSWLPFPIAQTLLVFINNILYLLGIGLTLYELRTGVVEVIVCVTICTLLFFNAIRQTFGLGQINGLIVFLMASALVLTVRRRDTWSGALIILAAALKLSPIMLLGFFAAQRRWRAWMGAVFSGLALVAILLFFTGWISIRYFATQVLPLVGLGSAAFPNQSLLGALYRLVVPLSVIQSSDAISDYPAVRTVWLIISIGLVVITFWLTARARLDDRWRVAVGYSIFVVVGLVIGSVAWDHYLLWLAVPVCAVIVDWFHERWLRPIGFWPIFLIALVAVTLPIPFQAALYHSTGSLGSSLSTIGLLLLCGLMAWRLATCRRLLKEE